MASILIIEDDDSIAASLQAALAGDGHQVGVSHTAGDALRAVAETPPHLVVLDLGLPDLDGLEVCRRIRRADPHLPILILTARDEEIDIVIGLDAGADDYLTKPFRLAEMLARIRALLRRPAGQDRLVVGDLTLSTASRRAWLGERELDLRAKEFDLLAVLAREAGRVVTRETLMSEVWDEHWFGPTKTLDTHVYALRRKLGERTSEPSRITTLRGVGYRLDPR